MNQNKKGLILVAIILIIVVVAGYFIYQSKIEKNILDPKNCTYTVEGKNITMKDGYSEEGIAYDSVSKVITQYFGNEAFHDFNGDRLSDTAFIFTQNMGGSGTFYYLAVGLGDISGCKGTNAIFLGDRISPQTTEVQDGNIIVNYADRRIDEPMVAHPSIGVTRQFALEGVTLKEVTSEESKKEQSCLLSGGTIEASLCCASTSDFPNLCLIGACGCSPTNSHQVKKCNCGEDKCFNGTECI